MFVIHIVCFLSLLLFSQFFVVRALYVFGVSSLSRSPLSSTVFFEKTRTKTGALFLLFFLLRTLSCSVFFGTKTETFSVFCRLRRYRLLVCFAFLLAAREIVDGYTGHHRKARVIKMRKSDGTLARNEEESAEVQRPFREERIQSK
jgi:hypothetical protein